MRISRYAHSLTISRSKSLASLSESEEPESDLLHMKKKKVSFIVAEMYSMYLVQDFGPIWIRIQGYTSLKEKKKNNFWETISFKKSTGIFFNNFLYKNKMSPKEICTHLSFWIVDLLYILNLTPFYLHFILYLHLWIRIQKAPDGFNTDSDPQHCFLQSLTKLLRIMIKKMLSWQSEWLHIRQEPGPTEKGPAPQHWF